MPKKPDLLDFKILEALGRYGPRNITQVARKIGLPAETLRKRLKRIISQFFVRFHINIYHTNLGLKKAIVFAEATPGKEQLLFNCMKAHDFWLAIARCYGRFEGCTGVFTIPKDHSEEFIQFLKKITELGVAQNLQVLWSTCFQTVPFTCNWFDAPSETWAFQWDKWIEEVPTEGGELPYTLVDPEDFPIKGDEIDLFILKELEKDAKVDLSVLSRKMGISSQLAQYHFKNHILKRGLLESFDMTFFYFDRAISDVFFFVFKFDDKEHLSKFALSLLDKPFAWGLGKILGENALFAKVYLTKFEFRNFIDALSILIRKGLLQSYSYVVQDLEKTSRQTISYEYFKDGSWIYDHNKHIQSLKDLVEGTELEQRVRFT